MWGNKDRLFADLRSLSSTADRELQKIVVIAIILLPDNTTLISLFQSFVQTMIVETYLFAQIFPKLSKNITPHKDQLLPSETKYRFKMKVSFGKYFCTDHDYSYSINIQD